MPDASTAAAVPPAPTFASGRLARWLLSPTTLLARLTRVFLAVALPILLISGLASQIYLNYHGRIVARDNLHTQALALANSLESAVAFNDAKFAQKELDTLRHYPDLLAADIVLPEGLTLVRYGNSIDEPLAHELASGSFITWQRHGIVVPIGMEGETLGQLRLVGNLQRLNRDSLLVVAVSLLFGGLLLALALRVFQRMSHEVTEPIRALADIMHTIEEQGDYRLRATDIGGDEVGQLARGFNTMLGALEVKNANINAELTERKKVQSRLDRLAHYDTLTQLPNRHYFQKRLDAAVDDSIDLDKSFGLLFVDIDNFKLVNDSLGHTAGDVLLKTVGERLAETLRSGDIVCRLGGDEFAVILDNLANASQLDVILDKIMQQLVRPVLLENQEAVITASIGVALCPADAETPELLLRYADTAMYAAKGDGKNAWKRFAPEMAARSALRLTMENQLRQALKFGHFDVHYQPQIDLGPGKSGSLVGFEALVRWNDPERGFISPGLFIPVAEESGLIRPLGEWVLRTACADVVRWNLAGHPNLKVAVNVSARQLIQGDFPAHVMAILEETGCPVTQLELEITESVLMQHADQAIAQLVKLRDLGIGIAIDDFGTGYSSMAQLKSLPVNKLKIDKSFVDDIAKNRNDLAITATIANLAHNLQIQVIAEGVEDSHQVLLLRQTGCHFFQGYHFSRPLSRDKADAYLAEKSQDPNLSRATPNTLSASPAADNGHIYL